MFDPSPNSTALTLTEILGWAREISIIGVIVGASWKCRGLYDSAEKFIERIEQHMTKMENFAETVIDNHLDHIQKALNTMANIEDDTHDKD